MKYFDLSQVEEAVKSSRVSGKLKNSIDSFLQDAASAIERDMREEGKERINLVKAANFLQFYKEHKEDFDAFGEFLSGYQDAYAYEWKHLYAFLHCILMFKCKMPNRIRLIELTGHYEWVLYALEDEDICRYIIRNFALYANTPERFLDDNGDIMPIIEIVYNKLFKMAQTHPYPEDSAQSRLRETIYQYLFTDFT